MLAEWSVHASTIFYGYGNSDIDFETNKHLVSAFIFSFIDYCDAVLYGPIHYQ